MFLPVGNTSILTGCDGSGVLILCQLNTELQYYYGVQCEV
jgi:hypothetical protein